MEKIEKLQGIKSLEINPFTGNLSIDFFQDKTGIEEIKLAILSLGFNISEVHEDNKKDIFILKNKLAISLISSIIIYILNIEYTESHLPDFMQNNLFDFIFVSFTQLYCCFELLKESYSYLKRKIFSYHLLSSFFIFYLYLFSITEIFSPDITLGMKIYFTEFSILISILLFERYLFLMTKNKLINQYNKLKKDADFSDYKKLLDGNISINSRLFVRNREILRYYPLFILMTSILTFLFWLVYDRVAGVGNALMFSVAPIMINLPFLMTLSLVLPFSNCFLFSGLKKKFYYKNSRAIEALDKTDTIVFDKTVVIVDKIPMITDIFTFNEFDGNTVLKISASVENQVNNNISRAIVKEAKNRDFDLYTPSSINHILGVGIEAFVNSYQVFIGSKEFMKMKNVDTTIMERISNKVSSELKTPIFVAINGKPAGLIATLNIVKKDAVNLNDEMNKINITPILITGDSLKSGITYGESIGLQQKNIYTDCIPTKKLKVIEELKKKNHHIAILKSDFESDYYKMQDDIVISIDKRVSYNFDYDISIHNSDLDTLKDSFIHAVKIMRKTKQNLFFTYFYSMIALLFAYGLLYKLTSIKPSAIFFGISTSITISFLYLNSFNKNKETSP